MIVHVLACDYDGTLATLGRVAERTTAALDRVRASGRKVLLVTGRMLSDLRRVCPSLDTTFDAVIAENGAVLYLPERRETRALGPRPEPAFLQALTAHGVRYDVGEVIVATTEAFAEPALAAIRDTGVEWTLVFNKGSVMALPGGVTKATGLDAALDVLALSRHNTVGIGDAENDHAFLAVCEFAVAVADAVPALRERADVVTDEPGAQGVVDFIERHVLRDLQDLAPRVARLQIELGTATNGEPVRVPIHRTRMLVVGPSASGKSTITGLVIERLVGAELSVCILDPEGDYQTLGDVPSVLVLGGKAERALPIGDELDQLLRRPGQSLVLNLSAQSAAEKVAYATQALASIAAARGTTGMPHWLVVDEAHHVFPAEGSPASALVAQSQDALVLTTLELERLAPDVRRLPNVIASTDLDVFNRTVRAVFGDASPPPSLDGPPLERGEAALATLGNPSTRVVRFRLAERRLEHRRHIRKYAEGELPPDRSFFFRGAGGRLNLRAANLTRFCELAEGVDDATWAYHLEHGDYSAWVRDAIKDADLAADLRRIEARAAPAAETRRAALEAIRSRYAV